ncbi:GBS Bsp-like repeat-containing protein [Streptococcus sp.]
MRKKDFIYFASAAVLLAASVQVAHADEVGVKESAVTESEAVTTPANSAPVVEEKQEVGTHQYVAPAPVTDLPVTSSEVTKAEEPQVETKPISAGESVPSSESTAKPVTGSTTFFNTGSNAPASRSTDVAVQPKSFVDVSSHNGDISIGDYRTLANKGVGGVVVKLTEDIWYKNPNAENQIRNAQAAGLQVSTYHFSRYTSEEAARAEARFYIAAAQRLNLPKNTLMVNNFEDAKMQSNINRNTQAWVDEMRKNGYTNLMFYTSASWLDENNLRKKGPVNTAQFGLQNFWVAQYPSPKLSVNDAKSLRYNGKAGAWQFTSQAELLQGKHLFDHSVDYTGRFTANAKPAADPTEGTLSGKINIVNNNTMAGRFDVVISNVKAPNGVRIVSVPIWSEIGGQDDLVWYTANRQANGTYTVNVKATDHKNSTGLYNIHLYYVQNNGQMTGVGGTVTNVFIGKRPEDLKPSGAVTIENNNSSTGTFDAVVRNVVSPTGLKEVLIPSWSVAGGQDDLIWHKATRQSDGSYRATIKASDHKNSVGQYQVHVHYIDQENKRRYVTETVVEVRQSKPQGTLSIENNNSSTGTFDAVVRNVVSPTGLKEVLIPSWSVAGGQDDLVWHKATRQSDGSYRATIKASDHNNSVGQYQVHVHYLDQNNRRRYVTETVVEVRQSKPQGTLSIENNNSSTGTFDVVVRNVVSPTGLKEVLIPSWSVAGGQDDLVWHKAVRQSDGSYRATIKASDHKNSVGQYQVHVHYLDQNNRRRYVTETIVEVQKTTPTATITIQNNNKDNGTFDVIISNVYSPKGVRTVQVPTWSEVNGQDDLTWYEATRQSDGTYKVSVKASDHKFSTGTYHVHLYYIQGDGSQVGVGGTTVQVENRNFVTRNQLYLKHLSAKDADGQLGRVLKAASSLIGVDTGSPEHLKLVRDYNSVHPLPVGYPVKNTDDWCDVFVTTVFQREGLSHLIGRECGVERHIQIFKNLGIWNENGASTPKSGDIITFNWDQDSQPNNGFADHIGIVEYVENGLIHTIEGNSGDVGTVKRNVYRIGHGNIRGFATPRYR